MVADVPGTRPSSPPAPTTRSAHGKSRPGTVPGRLLLAVWNLLRHWPPPRRLADRLDGAAAAGSASGLWGRCRARNVAVAPVGRTVSYRRGRREHPVTGGEGRLPPGVHGRAVGGVRDVGPHPGSVGPGADGVDVVAEELVIEDAALGRAPRVAGGARELGRPSGRRAARADRRRPQHPALQPWRRGGGGGERRGESVVAEIHAGP